MNYKEIYKRLIYYVAVPKCACCREILDYEDRALCRACAEEYNNVKLGNCSVCSRTYDECTCSNEYLEKHMVKRLVKVFRYKRSLFEVEKVPPNELLYVIKREKRRDIIDLLSDELVRSIKANIKYTDFIVTNVPRKRSRAVKYGLDHSKELAKAVAKKLGLDYVESLRSNLDVAQKKTHGAERMKNAKFDYRKRTPDLKGKRVFLVDDIVTTGASMGNCAMLLRGLGAKEVVGVCVSVAFKDKYTPFAPQYHAR